MSDKKTTPKKRAGNLQGDVTVKLHTVSAQVLFRGRQGVKGMVDIFGLFRFAGTVKQIYLDAAADNPWADWWLIRMDEAITKATEELTRFQKEASDKEPSSNNIVIGDVSSVEPLEYELHFSNNFVYRMCFLILEYDKFCCQVQGGRHVGFLTGAEAERYKNLGSAKIRHALASCGGYRHRPVTRNDLLAKNQLAQQATELMGEVPEDIFTLKRRSDYAPELRQYDDTNGEAAPNDVPSLNNEEVTESTVAQ